ncbi:MAG: AarF/ABC1/UbiB kinase family protein [Thermoplasmata archaeon]|nr:MAG: AarF/ABC1/UbiB kinase family protein [Thermoplasmata archaeon]
MLNRDVLDDSEGPREPVRRLLSQKYVHYKRVGEILSALSRYGFGRLWDATSLLKDTKLDSEEKKDIASQRSSVRFRLLLESLGPTFIKLGQMLSTRSDLIPKDYAEELGSLRDDVPPIPIEKVKEIVEEELGKKINAVFEFFDKSPIAAASIGQVHVGILKGTKEKVAVKVQRPDIKEIIKADIEILNNISELLKRAFKNIENFDPQGIIDEFGHMILREIDYTLEARNIERFKDNMSSLESVVIPKVYWKFSTKKVLCMEFIEGASLDSQNKLREMNTDFKAITDTLGRAYIKQIFIDGFFHADPHQDNIFVMKGNRVCFLDFGAIGYMNDETREQVGTFYISLIQKNVSKAASTFVEMSQGRESEINFQRLEWDLRDFIDFSLLKKEDVPIAEGMNQRMADIAIRHKLMLPSSFFLFERALMQVEGVCRDLNPKFDIVEVAQANIIPLLQDRYKLRPDPIQALETAREYRKFAHSLPKRADKILRKLESDQLMIKVDHAIFDDLKSYIRKIGVIVSISIMAAALVIYIAWTGQVINIEFLPITLSVLSIVIIWLIAVIIIYRRL